MTNFKEINEISRLVYELAHEKGWYDTPMTEDAYIEKCCNNLHDETSELHEAFRNNHLRELCDKSDKMKAAGIEPLTCLEEELADIFIRVCDNAYHLKVDLASAVERKHAFNATRAYRHGGKKT